MARIALTSRFNEIGFWPGYLFEANSDTEILQATATRGRIRFAGPDAVAEGYSVVVNRTGFTYDDGLPVSGTLKSVRVLDPAGRTVITFSDLAPGTLASDLSNFVFNVFGAESTEYGPGPSGLAAWNHLLSGHDTITGTAGSDYYFIPGNNRGDDVYNMGAGDDWIHASAGDDAYNGGDGFDVISFQLTHFGEDDGAFRGAIINRQGDGSGGLQDCWGGLNSFTGIEQFIGSRFNDIYSGSDGDEIVAGLRGADSLYGGHGENDLVFYQDDYYSGGIRGIRANLETSYINAVSHGRISDGFGTVDTVVSFEQVEGTRFDDVFFGSRSDNWFWGGEGTDSYNGKAGIDTVSFRTWYGDAPPGRVKVDLRLAAGQVVDDGFGNTETMIGIERVFGGVGNDNLRGNTAKQTFIGEEGSDVMFGHGGRDTFVWLYQPDIGDVDRIGDFRSSGPAGERDVLSFAIDGFANMTSEVVLVNGAAATSAAGTFVFNAANDTLYWDSDGTGAIAAQATVVLTNVNALTAASFDLLS